MTRSFGALIALLLLAMPAAASQVCESAGTGGKICVQAACRSEPSNDVDVWVTTQGDLTGSQSGNHVLKIDHYNVRGNCFNEQKEIGLQAGALTVPNGGCNISVQACERGSGLLASSVCSAWAGQFSPSDSLCPRPAAPPPPPDPCAGRMGTQGCPFPSFGGSSAQNDFTTFCAEYASQSVAVIAKAASLSNCAKSGPRWDPNVSAHAQWCLRLNGDPSPANAETKARADELDQCSVASRQTIGVKSPRRAMQVTQ